MDTDSPVTALSRHQSGHCNGSRGGAYALSAVTLGRRDKRHCGEVVYLFTQYCNPVFDFVEGELQDITTIGRLGVIVTGRRGGGRG